MGSTTRHEKGLIAGVLLATLLSIFLISKISGFRTGIPSHRAEATFFSPLHLTQTLISQDSQSVEILKTLKTQREAIWKNRRLGILLILHSILVIYFIFSTRSAAIHSSA